MLSFDIRGVHDISCPYVSMQTRVANNYGDLSGHLQSTAWVVVGLVSDFMKFSANC